MRRISVTVLLCFCVIFSVEATGREIAAGTVQISGASRFSSTSATEKVDNSAVDIDVDASELLLDLSYFLRDNVGVGFGYIRERTLVEDLEEVSVAFGPQLILNVSTSPVASVQLTGMFVLVDSELADATGSVSASGSGFGFGASIAYFLAPSAAATFGISHLALNQSIDNSDIDFSTTGTSVGVGLIVLLD